MSKPVSSTARRLNPKLIRKGDLCKVVVPKIVARVGYPKAVEDYIELAREKYGEQLTKDLGHGWLQEKALRQIAYGLAKQDGFGGKERSIHLKEVPELLGRTFTVSHVRTVMTGTYYPPYYGRSSYESMYDDDWEPGGLANMKHNRLASGWELDTGGWRALSDPDVEIPVEHLEKLNV